MRRGAIYWIDLDPTRGSEIKKTRPCVIVSHDAINRARRTVVVVPLSSAATPRPPLVIPVPSAGATSTAICDQIRAVDKSRLADVVGQLSDADMGAIEDGLRVVLGI
jgi:mRNA interferase MazF